VKPLFVSPGHLCDQAGAVRLTLAAATRYRLPEPTRLAHQLVTRARRNPVRKTPDPVFDPVFV
jgi:deoxyribonuclease V